MNKELIVNADDTGVQIALLEDKRLVELHQETAGMKFSVGDLYLGKVKKLMPGLNATFVDVGFEKDAFLHYTDLSPYIKSLIKYTQLAQNDKSPEGFDFSKFTIEPEIVKSGKITEVFSKNMNVLVQILKEPISAKGPRLSCEISLPGRYVVITPFNDVVAVSKKIHDSDERKRLEQIVYGVKPKNIGVIVRTAAENQSAEELHKDLLTQINKWNSIQSKLKGAEAPCKILSEETKTTSYLRDLLTPDFYRIIVNDEKVYDEVKDYLEKIAPEKVDILSLFHTTGPTIFDQYHVTKQLKASFGRTVNTPSGAYLIIERTEACHVIDVNSGYKNVSSNQEENAIATNLEAAEEIARQLRLRDLGGIIIVDFIDMKNPENKKALFDKMEELLKSDRARHSVLPLSKFGLMQITRQRMAPEVVINTDEICPLCHGTGKISSSVALEEDIESRIQYLNKNGNSNLVLKVNPIVFSHLTKGMFWNSLKYKWKKKYKIQLEIEADPSYPFTEFAFYDSKGSELN